MNIIKGLIFDLDGVLVDTKKIHFDALNKALKSVKAKEISFKDHLNIYDGLPTNKKLAILNKKKNLDIKLNSIVAKLKQKHTSNLLCKNIKFNSKIYNAFSKLSKNYKISLATNAVKKTLNTCIKKLKIKKFIFQSYSNEDVINNKPHPEVYLKCLVNMGLKPSETLIFEDSHHGVMAAQDSGCLLYTVKNISDINYTNIKNKISNFNKDDMKKSKSNFWSDTSLNILIPMAGAGSRFQQAGYIFPKPLIEINNKPMIQCVIDSLKLEGNYIFIVQKEHQVKYNINSVLKILKPNCKIIELDEITEGAACTTLLAKKLIDNNNPLIIANSDQYIEWDSIKSMYNFNSKKIDGSILTFEAIHPKWSYAKVDKNNLVTEVAEKKVISKNATVGVYYWKKGSDYVKYADQMIKKNIRVNNEFYVCPVFNEAILDKKKIIIDQVDEMHGLGTPEDLNSFLTKKIIPI
jgi:beta-phosphoglucomutase-like phosphatase (HAD superfamily)/dTDP-glucose pyrophosphorylase|tara:strand:+ start:507 stop:1895 length:1389 start_codon:yes stop_codon:yes gene_type:complete